MTAAGARIASGPLPRREILAQFAPDGVPRDSTPAARRVDLLVTTDLLSEGVNLQRASVIVHLDIPWNPARLEQREGEAASARITSRSDPRLRDGAARSSRRAAAGHRTPVARKAHGRRDSDRNRRGNGTPGWRC